MSKDWCVGNSVPDHVDESDDTPTNIITKMTSTHLNAVRTVMIGIMTDKILPCLIYNFFFLK